jgi:hypothetical protein
MARSLVGRVAIFSHGQFLRALAVRWIELPIQKGRHFDMDTASLNILAYEHNSLVPNQPADRAELGRTYAAAPTFCCDASNLFSTDYRAHPQRKRAINIVAGKIVWSRDFTA